MSSAQGNALTVAQRRTRLAARLESVIMPRDTMNIVIQNARAIGRVKIRMQRKANSELISLFLFGFD